MILDPVDFDGFIADIGQDMMWRAAFACPCVSPSSGAAALNCPHCDGKGQLWEAEVPTRLAAAGQKVQKTWANFGMYEDGDQVTIVPSDSPAYGIGPFDRVRSLNRTEPFSLNVVRGVNDRIRFRVASIDRVMYLDGDNLAVAPVPRTLSDGLLDWGDDGPPGSGSADGFTPPAPITYSVKGRRYSEWFVFQNLPFDRPHFGGQTLPRRVVLRRWDLYSR